MIWDRNLIAELFGFEYRWEVYTPVFLRKYGYYVLPLLYGNTFIGRVEMAIEKKSKTVLIKNVWYETGVNQTKQLKEAFDNCMKRFAGYIGCGEVKKCVRMLRRLVCFSIQAIA